MERKMMGTLKQWRETPDKKALLVIGARQVGKTYIIDQFGKSQYKNYLKLDMRKDPSLRKIFASQDIDSITSELASRFPGYRVEKGESLLFVDEIHDCPDATLAMRSIVLDGRIDIIGASTPIEYSQTVPKSYPIGQVHEVRMHGLDFEEYLWATGMTHADTQAIRRRISDKTPYRMCDADTVATIEERFRQYLIVGGMPDMVRRFLTGNGLDPVIKAQEKMIGNWRRNMESTGDLRMRRIFDLIPETLSRKSKKLRYKDIEDKDRASASDYDIPLYWLKESQYVSICYKLNSIECPLLSSRNRSGLKMHLMDTGLLVNMLGAQARKAIRNNELDFNEWAIAENAVGEALAKCGISAYYYDNTGEGKATFIAEIGRDLCAIAFDYSGARALLKLMKTESGKNIKRWIVFCESGPILVARDGIEYYPLFCAAFADSLSEVPEIKLLRADPNVIISPDRGS